MLAPAPFPLLRPGLLRRLATARARTDLLFGLLRPAALYERPIPERHRVIFYLGHLEAFDVNLILGEGLGRGPLHQGFDRLFAFGIDPVDGRLPGDAPADWPPIDEVRSYLRRARRAVDEAIEEAPLDDPRHPYLMDGWALRVAIEHRLMHAETLAYMLHQMAYDAKVSGPPPGPPGSPPVRSLVEIPRGRARVGLERARAPALGWDNEYEAHFVEVPAFAMESHDVTAGDFLRFVLGGGYDDRALWSEEGWRWKTEAGVSHPLFWRRAEEGWRYRGMFAEVPLDPSRPVFVSHAEASAYARFAGRRLPSEAEFHRAAYGAPGDEERDYPWGNEPPRPEHGAFAFSTWDPAPAGAHPQGDSAFGVKDLVGNGWEWTRTVFAPFAGFEPLPFYRGYSADFFDGRHFVLKGASPQTDASLLRRSFRNWFQPHYPYVYAAFRGVEARE